MQTWIFYEKQVNVVRPNYRLSLLNKILFGAHLKRPSFWPSADVNPMLKDLVHAKHQRFCESHQNWYCDNMRQEKTCQNRIVMIPSQYWNCIGSYAWYQAIPTDTMFVKYCLVLLEIGKYCLLLGSIVKVLSGITKHILHVIALVLSMCTLLSLLWFDLRSLEEKRIIKKTDIACINQIFYPLDS